MDTNTPASVSVSSNTQLTNKTVGDLRMIEVIIILFIIWVLVDLWVIFFRNLARQTFGLDERNPVHSFAYALAVTIIVLAFIILAGEALQQTLVSIGLIPEEFNPGIFGQDQVGSNQTNASVQINNPNPNNNNDADEILSFVEQYNRNKN